MHAEAERGRRGVVVYLLPGLTCAQRNAALRRLRQEGSRGCGPRLPTAQLAAALAADRLRAGAGNTWAAVRRHPVGILLPMLLACGVLWTFVLTSASALVIPAQAPGSGGAASSSVAATPGRASGSEDAPPGNASPSRMPFGQPATRGQAARTAHHAQDRLSAPGTRRGG